LVYDVQLVAPDGRQYRKKVELAADGSWSVDGVAICVDAVSLQPGLLSVVSAALSFEIRRDDSVESGSSESILLVNGRPFTASVIDPRSLRSRRGSSASSDGPKKLTAPMPGKVVRIVAPVGTVVEAGQAVIVIEAMKMQNELKSPKSGTVKKVDFAEGATVNAGDTLAVIE